MASLDTSVNSVYDLGSQPVTKASNFYSLYYMSKVADFSPADSDLQFIASQISDSMLYYGIMAITKELGSTGAFVPPRIPNSPVSRDIHNTFENSLHEFVNNGGDIDTLANYIQQEHSLSNKATEILKHMNSYQQDVNKTVLLDKHSIRTLLENSETDGSISSPYQFLSAAKEIFQLPYWPDSMAGTYGGDSWASICEYIQQSQDVSDIIFTDMGFSIHHNSGNWLDKVEIGNDERDLVLSLDSDTEFLRGSQLEILDDILDNAKDGDIKEVVDIAAQTGQFDTIARGRRLL